MRTCSLSGIRRFSGRKVAGRQCLVDEVCLPNKYLDKRDTCSIQTYCNWFIWCSSTFGCFWWQLLGLFSRQIKQSQHSNVLWIPHCVHFRMTNPAFLRKIALINNLKLPLSNRDWSILNQVVHLLDYMIIYTHELHFNSSVQLEVARL